MPTRAYDLLLCNQCSQQKETEYMPSSGIFRRGNSPVGGFLQKPKPESSPDWEPPLLNYFATSGPKKNDFHFSILVAAAALG